MTMLTRILASSVRIIRGLGEPISFFFYNGGIFSALAMGLQRYIKAIYMCVGPYEIRFNFSQIPFRFFSKFIFFRFNFSRFRFFSFKFHGLLFND